MPKSPKKPLREWRVSIIRAKTVYLGRVDAPDEKSAIEKAADEFGIDKTRRFRLIAEPAE